MENLLNWLSGRKTYITAFLFALFNFGASVGWWTPDSSVWEGINYLLGALGFGFLRSGMKKDVASIE
jgi:hypothetical protein